MSITTYDLPGNETLVMYIKTLENGEQQVKSKWLSRFGDTWSVTDPTISDGKWCEHMLFISECERHEDITPEDFSGQDFLDSLGIECNH